MYTKAVWLPFELSENVRFSPWLAIYPDGRCLANLGWPAYSYLADKSRRFFKLRAAPSASILKMRTDCTLGQGEFSIQLLLSNILLHLHSLLVAGTKAQYSTANAPRGCFA